MITAAAFLGPILLSLASADPAPLAGGPDIALWRFDSLDRKAWSGSSDPGSTLGVRLDSSESGRFLRLDYRIQQWANAGDAPRISDWSNRAGLVLRARGHKPGSTVQVALVDATGEQWIATGRIGADWGALVVPFREFGRNPWYQPPGAGEDRRLDLQKVSRFQIQPEDQGPAGRLDVASIALTDHVPPPEAKIPDKPAILGNLVGWTPHATKRFLVAGGHSGSWKLLDDQDRVVQEGRLTAPESCAMSGLLLSTGEVSSYAKPGTYRLAVDSLRSEPFAIRRSVLEAPFRDALRAFYFLRSGVDLREEHAGPWARRGGHPDTSLGYAALDVERTGRGSAPGGWYDAGDYGKYVVNAGITVATLMHLQELLPGSVPDRGLDIPESGNGVPDLLDEIRYELDWMVRMQDADGGVFFKVAGKSWPGMVMPSQDRMPRFLIGKSTASTLNFAAAMAQASRVWKKVDAKFARDCRERAERAWAWAVAHPDVVQPAERGGSGPYADPKFGDEFLWAASELWVTTGEARWRAEVASRLAAQPMMDGAWWGGVQNLGQYSIALHKGRDSLGKAVSARLDSVALRLRGMVGSSPLRVPLRDWNWGSTGDLANRGVLLAFHHALRGDKADLEAMTEIVDHVLGRNANGTSYLSGYGVPSMRDPHLRFAVADTVALPPPGFVSGGPNGGRQDEQSRNPGGVKYPHSEPARSWVDDHRSYASNEVAINWNAPVALLLGYLSAKSE